MSAAAAVLAALAVLTACGPVGGGPAAGGARTVLSESRAREILERYVEANDRAGRNGSPEALAAVEGGAHFEQSTAEFRHLTALDGRDRRRLREPFRYVASETEFFIPARGDWYMAYAPVEGGGVRRGPTYALLVFERTADTAWKLVAAVRVDGELPEPARGENGLPVRLPDDARVGDVELDDLDEAVSDLYVSGGRGDGGILADSRVKRHMIEDYRARRDWIEPEHADAFDSEFETVNGEWEDAYRPAFPDAYTLRTADGGALTVFTSYNSRVDVAVRPDHYIIPGDIPGLYVRDERPPGVREYYSVQNLVHVPARGKPRQLGGERQLIGAGRQGPPGHGRSATP